MDKQLLELDISYVSKKKATKKDIVKYARKYDSLNLSRGMTKDQMLDSILEKRKQDQERIATYEQRLRDGIITYDVPDLALTGPVLLPLEYGIPLVGSHSGWLQPIDDAIYENVARSLNPPPISDTSETLILQELLENLDGRIFR